jgi:uncharacterized protein YciI
MTDNPHYTHLLKLTTEESFGLTEQQHADLLRDLHREPRFVTVGDTLISTAAIATVGPFPDGLREAMQSVDYYRART